MSAKIAAQLITQRRFLPLLLAQCLGSLNDNLFRYALVTMVTFSGLTLFGIERDILVPIAASMITLPIFLFSAIAGRMADRFDRTRIMRVTKQIEIWIMLLAAIVIALIGFGKDTLLQRTLTALVCLLSVAFLITAATGLPSPVRILKGLLTPNVSGESLSLVVAMIGTTIVPYNLFLHASRSASTWKETPRESALRSSRIDTVFSISLGGLVTASILLTACSAFYDRGLTWDSPEEIAMQLRPTLGTLSGTTFALGLFVAGLTSAITAPLATAYAVCGCLGWSTKTDSKSFRGIAIGVVLIGATMAVVLDGSPASTIVTAQIANGLVLPVVATIMLLVVRRHVVAREGQMATPATVAAWTIVFLIGALGLWRMTTGVMRLL